MKLNVKLLKAARVELHMKLGRSGLNAKKYPTNVVELLFHFDPIWCMCQWPEYAQIVSHVPVSLSKNIFTND